MSTSRSNVNDDNDDVPLYNVVAVQDYRPHTGNSNNITEISNYGGQSDMRKTPQEQTCLRNQLDPDGAYYESHILKSPLQEEMLGSASAFTSNNNSHSMLMSMRDNSSTDLPRLTYIDSKVASTLDSSKKQHKLRMQSMLSRRSVHDNDYDDYCNHQNREHVDEYQQHTLLEGQESYWGSRRFESTGHTHVDEFPKSYNIHDTTHSESSVEYENHQLQHIGSVSVSGTSLSEYEARIRSKCSTAGRTMTTATEPLTQRTIEITPGHFVRLRGAVETWNAIQDDFYLPCSCICCNLTLFCIQDAAYVLCPACNDVSPMENVVDYDGGLGLGFTMDELFQWQKQMFMNNG